MAKHRSAQRQPPSHEPSAGVRRRGRPGRRSRLRARAGQPVRVVPVPDAREEAREQVRRRFEDRFGRGLGVAPRTPVVRLALPSPMGDVGALTVAEVQRAWKRNEAALCAFCLALENAETEAGLLTALLCDSCRIIVSSREPGCGGCGAPRWVNEVGLVSAWCKDCHQARKSDQGAGAGRPQNS